MILSALKLSILVVTISTLMVAFVGLALGYLLARKDFMGKELLDSILTLPMVMPPTVTGYYLIVLLGRNGIFGETIYNITGFSITFTWQAAVIASFIVSLPLMIKSSRSALEAIDRRFEQLSYLRGRGWFETFYRVVLPLAKRGIIAGIILSFARGMGEFGATLMLAGNIPGKTQTMPLAIYEAVASGEDTQATILALILTGVSIFVIYLTNLLTKKMGVGFNARG